MELRNEPRRVTLRRTEDAASLLNVAADGSARDAALKNSRNLGHSWMKVTWFGAKRGRRGRMQVSRVVYDGAGEIYGPALAVAYERETLGWKNVR